MEEDFKFMRGTT